MKKYLAYLRCGFLDGCAYRQYFITGMLANFIQAVVLFFVWKTILDKGIMPSEKVLDFPVDCNTLTGSVNL